LERRDWTAEVLAILANLAMVATEELRRVGWPVGRREPEPGIQAPGSG
jgi:hypothetical protein